jgi:hypothetical protein
MAYGNNRSARRPRSSVQRAGGTIIIYRHPFLAGQVSKASPVDSIDVSKALKLNEQFFSADPAQDNAIQEVLVDGSTITITNSQLNGKATLSVVSTTGLVGEGDLIAAAHIVIASGDDIGGTLTVKQFINGKCRTTLFYGVTWANVPHLRIAGNAVVTYPMVMLYAGWIQGVTSSSLVSEKTIWAVGNKYGLTGNFKQYGIMDGEDTGEPYTDIDSSDEDKGTLADAVAASALSEGVVGTPTTVTWGP